MKAIKILRKQEVLIKYARISMNENKQSNILFYYVYIFQIQRQIHASHFLNIHTHIHKDRNFSDIESI